MAPKDTALQLLQLIALMLPAVAIYFDTTYPEMKSAPRSRMADGTAANYHAIRLTFFWLLLSAGVLLVEVLMTPDFGETLVALGIVLLAAAIATFTLPILFDIDGLKDDHSIFYPYRNAWDRLKDFLGFN